jgi:cytochrome c peroxidase
VTLAKGLTAACVLALVVGCQPAGKYAGRRAASSTAPAPEPDKPTTTAAPVPPDYAWIDPDPQNLDDDVPIVFVHAETSPDEWKKLPAFWNPPLPLPQSVAALLGLTPLTLGPLAAHEAGRPIKIKVPLGLDDPQPHLPAANPPTVLKWQLGRRLFFDKNYLHSRPGESCATCHDPEHGFTDLLPKHEDFNAPTLINCLYNDRQFWDGRAALLEEVVQRTLEDEREPDPPGKFRHVWGGVIQRLRANLRYRREFREAFGTEPTQDAVGRALATYLRTILVGNSLYDRARRVQAEKGAANLEAAHFEAVLDAASLKELERDKAAKADVAAELALGARLFFNRESGRSTNCIYCHGGGTFTDNGFHNLGVGIPSDRWESGRETGRFQSLPVGRKSARFIGAFKTPTLRALPRTGPYLHNGGMATLREVVAFHNEGGRQNLYLDDEMWADKSKNQVRHLGLNDAEIDALVLFLRALNGTEVDAVLKAPASASK